MPVVWIGSMFINKSNRCQTFTVNRYMELQMSDKIQSEKLP